MRTQCTGFWNDVEIGAGTTIDRGSLRDTVIGELSQPIAASLRSASRRAVNALRKRASRAVFCARRSPVIARFTASIR